MSQPAQDKPRRRRKPATAAERKAHAEEMRRRRAETKAAKSASCVQPATPPAPTTAGQPVQGPVAPTTETPAESKPAGLTLEQKEALLADALAGTASVLADTAQLIWLDAGAPHLGQERASLLGKLWAPILAPYIDEDFAKWLPLALAAGGTANAFYAWAHEYRAYRAAHPDKPGATANTPIVAVKVQPATEVQPS